LLIVSHSASLLHSERGAYTAYIQHAHSYKNTATGLHCIIRAVGWSKVASHQGPVPK